MNENDDLHAAMPALDEASRRALDTAGDWVGGDIHGVAIGETQDGRPALVVYAFDAGSPTVQALPSECQGLPVRVETGDAFAAE